MTLPPKVWEGVLERLEAEVPPHVYRAWLAPLEADLDGERVALRCPSPFHRDRILSQFLARIRQAFEQVLGQPVDVEVADAVGTSARGTGARAAGGADAGGAASTVSPRPPGIRRVEPTAADRSEPVAAVAGGARELPATPREGTPEPDDADAATPPRARGPADPDPPTLRIVPSPGGDSAAASGPRSAPAGELRPIAEAPARPAELPTGAHAPARSVPAERGGALPTFDSFVVGRHNALAREAAYAVAGATQPGLQQLFLAGASGLGKSHLARAAARLARERSGRGVLHVSAEGFTNEFLAAIRSKETLRFKARYRKRCEVLVIEDVQFLAGKDSTQLEFLHTVAHLLDAGGRVIATADRPATELTGLQPRLRALLTQGLVARLLPPDEEARCALLRFKASAGGVRLPEECLRTIAQRVRGSVRELEGVLIQLVASAALLKRPIDLALTREALDQKLGPCGPTAERPSLELVIGVVASFFQTSREALASRSRRRDVLVPRQLAMYLCRRYTEASLAEIGRELGREHPAVKNAIARVEREILERAPLRYQVEALTDRLDELLAEQPEDHAPH